MTKADLVSAISERSGLNQSQAKAALEAFLDCVKASMKGGVDVRVAGFGSFSPVIRPAGVARNPRTGAQVLRPACKTVRFRIGDGFKNALN